MKYYSFLVLALLCTGCQRASSRPEPRRSAATEAKWTDQEKALMRCLEKRGKYNKCIPMSAPRRMHGVWYTGFEESGFVPNVETVPLSRSVDGPSPEFDTRLEIEAGAALKQLGLAAFERCIRAVAIDFIGREAAVPVSSDGGFDSKVVAVDRLLGGRLIGRVRTLGLDGYDEQCATPAPSDAELKAMDEADMKRCEAEGRCIPWKKFLEMGKQEKK